MLVHSKRRTAMGPLPKVLVALDDSENAMRAVEYVSKNFSPDHEVTLFSVIPDTQMLCNINSPELTPYFWSQRNVFCSLEDKKKELIEGAANKARDLLLKAGFKKEFVMGSVSQKVLHSIKDVSIVIVS
jgi:nucleotide-binding universal stress UspA family protein